MTLSELKRRVMTALNNPSDENRLTLTIALNDYEDSKNERIEELEDVLFKLATSPWAPQRVVDMAREVLGSEEPRDGDAWSGGFAANH